MHILVGEGRRSWYLDQDLDKLFTGESHGAGLSAEAAWSPDGRVIAFWASPDTVEREGWSRAGGEWRLYLMDPEEQKPYSVLEGVYHAYLLAWSPDGKVLAYLWCEGLLDCQPTEIRIFDVSDIVGKEP